MRWGRIPFGKNRRMPAFRRPSLTLTNLLRALCSAARYPAASSRSTAQLTIAPHQVASASGRGDAAAVADAAVARGAELRRLAAKTCASTQGYVR